MAQKKSIEILNTHLESLEKINDLDELYSFVSDICDAVDDIYPCISCKSGCSTCCSAGSLPIAFPAEWKRMRDYINNLDETVQEQIFTNINKLFHNHKEVINLFHTSIEDNIMSMPEFNRLTDAMNSTDKCPLLINGKCSVYPARPTACRTFGYTFKKSSIDSVNILSCDSDYYKMKKYLSENYLEHPDSLPFVGAFEKKTSELTGDKQENFLRSVIPFWFWADLYSGHLKLSKKIAVSDSVEYAKNLYNSGLFRELELFYQKYLLNYPPVSEIEEMLNEPENRKLINFSMIRDNLAKNAANFYENCDYHSAETEYRRLFSYEPDNYEFSYKLAMSEYRQGKYTSAVETFTLCLKNGFYNRELFFAMADCLEKLGDTKTSAIYIQKAKQLSI